MATSVCGSEENLVVIGLKFFIRNRFVAAYRVIERIEEESWNLNIRYIIDRTSLFIVLFQGGVSIDSQSKHHIELSECLCMPLDFLQTHNLVKGIVMTQMSLHKFVRNEIVIEPKQLFLNFCGEDEKVPRIGDTCYSLQVAFLAFLA